MPPKFYRVTIAIPIKRGLKDEAITDLVKVQTVTIAIPIKRGLKEYALDTFEATYNCYNCYPD